MGLSTKNNKNIRPSSFSTIPTTRRLARCRKKAQRMKKRRRKKRLLREQTCRTRLTTSSSSLSNPNPLIWIPFLSNSNARFNLMSINGIWISSYVCNARTQPRLDDEVFWVGRISKPIAGMRVPLRLIPRHFTPIVNFEMFQTLPAIFIPKFYNPSLSKVVARALPHVSTFSRCYIDGNKAIRNRIEYWF